MSKLIESYRGFVYPWSMDHVGHMNVQFYTSRFDEATWHFLAQLGLTPTFLRESNRGMVALDQHTLYKQEVLAGTLLHVQTEPLEVKRKTIRFIHRMYNSETSQEVASTELVGAFLDKAVRKTTELPAATLALGQSWLESAAGA